MALDNDSIKQLIQQLEADRSAYLSTQNKLQEALVQILQQQQSQPDGLSQPHRPRTLSVESNDDAFRRPTSIASRRTNSLGLDGLSRRVTSLYSADDSSDSDDESSYYANDPLPSEIHTEDELRQHIRNYAWEQHSRLIFGPLQRSGKLFSPEGLFAPDFDNHNDANHTTADIYEVGDDGAPLKRSRADVSRGDQATWEVLAGVNTDKSRKQAIGRIVIMREPSPILYGALHLTMSKHFDMDSIYRMLIDDHQRTKAYVRGHAEDDHRKQRSIVFCFKYHTMVGEGREPLSWQNYDDDIGTKTNHIPISTCSSVVALSLSGPPAKTFRLHSRRTKSPKVSAIYDPFAPWHVLSIQNFPDWHSEVNLHETHHHYVNGPDAFLATLLHEYRDAAKRFRLLARQIIYLTKPPGRSVFDSSLRDELIFESGDFVFTRRYFWANQTLGALAEEIELMIGAYKETFTDEVWSGEHKTLLPGKAETSARFANWRKKMKHTRRSFELEMEELRDVLRFINREQKEIKSLREWLFSGTSVQESRQAVKQALITVEQGYNIKLLTLVTIFFLPLMFVTGVFGMTNMPPEDDFLPAIIMALAVCLPTYLLIAVINKPEMFQKGVAWILWPWVLTWTWTKRSNDYAADYARLYKERYLNRRKLKKGEKAAKKGGWMGFQSGGSGRGWGRGGRSATFASLEARLEQESKMNTGRRASRPYAFAQPSDVELSAEKTGKVDTSSPATVGGSLKPGPLPTSIGSSRGVASVIQRPVAPPMPQRTSSSVRFDTESLRSREQRHGTTPEPSPNTSVGNLDQIVQASMRDEAEQPTEKSRPELSVSVPTIQVTPDTESPRTPARAHRPSFLRRISSKLGNAEGSPRSPV
ncbi:uncharacterized protein HMPREF1541_02899 [Cyphellophora europaea CBS 101466]|uniref:Uncharacterized protein n=1 Tax=Cyphellophora europaea (strain CBS 101466) TaxID=1220924 RepID=W2S555_CYPE1|nr:uncharacterized protein HMPREF1541_02899 [Cyphellophora europaea CBS 101466]ETN43740.1 hypothetical protein HMPREF1541_02899 [Cyphellophora europaea CBS 101466]